MVEITLEDLTKSFSDELVIDSLNLKIESGELVALLGPSGCGKTTTLNIIAGLLDPDNGDLLFDQMSMLDTPTEEREAILVFQNYLLFPHLNVADNIAFGLKMRGVNKDIRKKRVTELLELVGLSGYGDSFPNNLSGGQQQRVALARALAINPKVLLLDEPFSNLDANLREGMQSFIRELHLKEDMTTIFVTHDRDEAMLMADKIAVMNKGKIEQYATPEALYRYPLTTFVADFFGRANYLKTTIREDKLLLINNKINLDDKNLATNLDLTQYKELRAMIRPEFLNINDSRVEADKQVEFKGEIVDKVFVGDKIYYQVDLGSEILEVTELSQTSFEVGREVVLTVSLEYLWLMEVSK